MELMNLSLQLELMEGQLHLMKSGSAKLYWILLVRLSHANVDSLRELVYYVGMD
jgi:hypothetical protein